MKEVLNKLQMIQRKLDAPKTRVTQRYKYRNCEDILEALKPLLEEQKCAVVLSDDVVTIGDRFYISATATLYDTETEAYVSNKAFAREDKDKKGMDGSQITGSASSYARKYALNGLFGIDDSRDSDEQQREKEQAEAEQRGQQTPPMPPPPDETTFVCADCGTTNTVTGMTINGIYYSAQQLVAQRAYSSPDGQPRCKPCLKKQNKLPSNQEAENHE